jgi:DMSO/TMAO reductase YedYZ molybdopterin-dependent catalytic subunit
MKKRNFYILVAAICVGTTCFWVSLYNFALYDINPLEHIEKSISELTEGEIEDEEIVLTIKGSGIEDELKLTLSEIKSDKYRQVKDKEFHFKNSVGTEWDAVYSGVSLWSILEAEDILKPEASSFLFIGEDGYEAPTTLSLSLAENNEDQVILAYEKDGEPLYEKGPLRSVIDYEVIPEYYNSQYSVYNLRYVEIK